MVATRLDNAWKCTKYDPNENGGGIWGSITGTLSNQTDLQTALDLKTPTSRTVSTSSPLGGGGALSGNLTLTCATCVTSAASLTSTALVTGAGSQGSQTPAATTTLDSSGNISTAGTLATGVGGAVAGNIGLGEGTSTSVAADTVQLQGAAAITGYNVVLPAAAGDGLTFNTNSSNVVTQTFVTAETVLASAASVDLNTATAQTLYTCPTGKTCVITRVVVRGASASLSTVSFSIGWNSASFNNVVADATHTELTGNTLYTILPAKAGATLGTSTGILKLLNNVQQGGAATCTVDVIGWWF